MNIVAVVSQKGGTGKSTVSSNIAVAAGRKGLTTLLCDTDPQGSLVEWRKLRRADAPAVMAAKSGAIHPMRFAAERAGLDLMVIDTQAGSVACAVEAAKIADLALIVVRPSPMDLHAMAATVAALKPLRRPCAFVLNQAPSHRHGREPTLVGEAIELLLRYGLPVAPIAVRARSAYQHAYAQGQSVLESDPQSSAASEIGELWGYVSERLRPITLSPGLTPRTPRLSVAVMAHATAGLQPAAVAAG